MTTQTVDSASIQTMSPKRAWKACSIDALVNKTGFEHEGLLDLAELYSHVLDCYPAQDWRIVDAAGNEIDAYYC
jgi:hypothetical protein